MNELKYQCINCARFHSELADHPFKPGDMVQCSSCNMKLIIGEITYFLHVHEPDPE